MQGVYSFASRSFCADLSQHNATDREDNGSLSHTGSSGRWVSVAELYVRPAPHVETYALLRTNGRARLGELNLDVKQTPCNPSARGNGRQNGGKDRQDWSVVQGAPRKITRKQRR